MKANRKFVNATEAVSPVIAVILMAAITVVLAATVFVLVSDIGNQGTKAGMTISFNQDDSLDRLTVTGTSTGADWNNVKISVSSCTQVTDTSAIGRVGTLTPYQNDAAALASAGTLNTLAATGTSCGAPTFVEVTGAADVIDAADFLEFCSSPATADMTNVVLVIVDGAANKEIGKYTFSGWDDC